MAVTHLQWRMWYIHSESSHLTIYYILTEAGYWVVHQPHTRACVCVRCTNSGKRLLVSHITQDSVMLGGSLVSKAGVHGGCPLNGSDASSPWSTPSNW